MGNPHLKIWYMTVLYMPTLKVIHSSFTIIYLKLTEIDKNVSNIENVFNIECIYLHIWQLLDLKCEKGNKWGFLNTGEGGRGRGKETFPKISKRLGTCT